MRSSLEEIWLRLPLAATTLRNTTMHDLQTARKLGVYQALYRINQSFAHLVSQCAELQELKILSVNNARRYRWFIQELQAEMNQGLANLIETFESRAQLRLIKARKRWEVESKLAKPRGIRAPVRRKRAIARKKQSGSEL